MSGLTPTRIDRLARRFAGRDRRTGSLVPGVSDERSLDRRSLLRAGAFGILAYSLRGAPSALAAPRVAAGCTGGSLKACYATVEKNFDKYVRTLCDTLKDKKGDPFGTASYSCYVGWLSSRLDARNDCRSDCPKPKKKKKPPPGPLGPAPPGPNPLPLPPPPPIPTCGHVDCVDNDVCCKAGSELVCCAICCAKGGGCGSSDSDCL
ncbi:MAG TPA: hypothetical protein VFA66_01270 [Gaiellaceae bacterium]|nr:hypothetical protein [Gaiellaceae bacterium]